MNKETNESASGAARPGGSEGSPASTGSQAKGSGTTAKAANETDAGAKGNKDAIALIKEDHRKVEGLFQQYEKAGNSNAKLRLIDQICTEFLTHSLIEERIFYPACRDKIDDDMLDEAQVEHDGAKILLMQLRDGSPADPYFDAKVKVLSEYVKHHVAEEEKSGDGILDAARKAGVDMAALGQQITERREEMAQRVEEEINPPMPSFAQGKGNYWKENNMAQQDYQERSRGRSSSRYDDDDDYRSGRRMPPRDEEGRFTSNGRSRSSSRYEEDDDYRSSRRTPPRDEEGRFMSSDRGRRSSRYDEDDDDRRRSSRLDSYARTGRYDDDDDGRGHGRGGWFGDSRGHSEAARRGWDDPDHGPSGWFGDSEGHSRAAQRGWDNPDHGPSGWFGDPEGHSEASRHGWDERGNSGRGRYQDDDDGYSRTRSSRSRRDDDDDDRGRGRGRGGWFGDSRGHSEAARRGWDNR